MSSDQARLSQVPPVLTALAENREPPVTTLRDAVRGLLSVLAASAPGRSVELRIPPFGAIQCVEGPTHRRGTPPNVVEMDGVTFVSLATGRLSWAEALQSGRIAASGSRADLSEYLPCWTPTM